MYRTHTCGELRVTDVNKTVTLAGWVQTVRKFGAITFVDLRDRYGITQLLFGEDLQAQMDANPLGREFVIQAEGFIQERSNKNLNIPTGEIEIQVHKFAILNKSAVPPFTITDETDGGDDLRRGGRPHHAVVPRPLEHGAARRVGAHRALRARAQRCEDRHAAWPRWRQGLHQEDVGRHRPAPAGRQLAAHCAE